MDSLINKFNMTLDFFSNFNPTFLEMIIGSGPLNFNQIYERITNRADLMNTTILDRLIKKTNALQYNDRVSKLREMAETRGFQLD